MSSIRQAVLIAAPEHKVFDALTHSEGLAAWWSPGAEAVPELGSTARFRFGPSYLKTMVVAALEPDALVQWRCTGGADEWIGTTISIALESGSPDALRAAHVEIGGQLEPLADVKTVALVRFAHEGWRAETLGFSECSYTWGRFLHSLKRYCETGRGTPWPEQHRA